MPWRGGSAGRDLLWEWNGVDTSQFESVLQVTSGNDSGWTAGAATTFTGDVSPQPGGVRLSLPSTGNGVTGTHWGIHVIKARLPASYEVQINSHISTVDTANAGYGIMFWGDIENPSAPYGYLYGRGRASRMDGSTTSINGAIATISAASNSQCIYRIEGRGDDPAGPQGQFVFVNRSATAQVQQFLRNRYNAADGDFNFAGVPAWGGNATMNRFGLCVFSTGGGGGAPTWNINSIRIRRL
jgi:hypothetical protein